MPKLTPITTIVSRIVCSLVGQTTFPSSAFTSLRNSKGLALFIFGLVMVGCIMPKYKNPNPVWVCYIDFSISKFVCKG